MNDEVGLMRILVSNDDGYLAPGIGILAEAMQGIAENVTVVAPDRDRSAVSNSLTVNDPLRVSTASNGFLYVNGTPTDCMHIAINGLLKEKPDMILSGINSGHNLGDDVLYSGTVAAAMEGRFLGSPAIAISCISFEPKYYETAARVAQILVKRLQSHQLPADTILNVNVPDLPYEELSGWSTTRLGSRHQSEELIRGQDPRGREIYWLGAVGAGRDAGQGTDFYAVEHGYVSVTPLKVDLTHHDALPSINDWMRDL